MVYFMYVVLYIFVCKALRDTRFVRYTNTLLLLLLLLQRQIKLQVKHICA